MAPSECAFCNIVNHEIPADIIYRDPDGRFIGFKDIRPAAPVHIIFTTMHHVTSLATLEPYDAMLIGLMLMAVKNMAVKLGIDQTGYRVVTNIGDDAGQTVKHLHFHLIGGAKTTVPLY